MSLLLERERELDRLAVRLDAARTGAGGLVVVEGAPGLGKTSLLRAAARAAKQRGFEVLRARGAQLEHEWPFGAVRQLLEPVLRSRPPASRDRLLVGAAGLAVPVLLPEQAATTEVDASFGTLHGLYWLCANLAAEQPIALAVDDAQWIDDASLRFLGVLARRLDALPVIVVVAQRPEPRRRLAELAADPQTEVLALRTLSVAASSALLSTWSPDRSVDAAFAVARRQRATGGIPVPVRAGSRRVCATRASRSALLTRSGWPWPASRLCARPSPPPWRGWTRALSLWQRRSPCWRMTPTSGLPASWPGSTGPTRLADRLAEVGVLEDARPLRFVHAIVRDAVAARLSAGGRSALHARAAELLAARRAPPDAIAVHLLAAEPRGRAWAVRQLATVAQQALAQGAPEAAITSLKRALREPPPAEEQAGLWLELARAESRLGRREAVASFQRAHDLAGDPVLRARAAIELVWASGPAVDTGAIAQLEDELAEIDERSDLALELRAARLAAVQILAIRQDWAAGERRRWGQLEGGTDGERLLLAQLAIGQMQVGGPARDCGDFARRAIAQAGFERIAGGELSLMLAIIALYKADDLDATDRVLARELHVAQQCGSRSGYAIVCNFRAAVAMRRGQLQTAEADARDGLEALGVDPWRRHQLMGALLDALTETGRLAEAQSILTDNDWEGDLPDTRATNVLLSFRARLRQAQGDHQRALDDALEVRRRTAHGRAVDTNWDGWARTALLNHTLGHAAAARDEAVAFLALARRWDTPAAIGQALATNGLIEGGQPGLSMLAEAVKQLERSPAHLLLAQALIDHGAALRRAGHRRQAREPLRRGPDIAAASGASPLTERARQELTASGLRIRRDAQTGIAALTPTERRVAEHAATGATNPQIAQALFVTVKTVEMHLGNAYRKLNITSRHQLPAHFETDEQSHQRPNGPA